MLILAGLSLAQISLAEEPKLTEREFRDLLPKFNLPSPGHALLRPITDAEERGDNAEVVKLCNELIEKPLDTFDSPQYGIALKSMAYMHRGRARAEIADQLPFYIEDSEQAAKLGNLQAMDDLNKIYMDVLSGSTAPIQGLDDPSANFERNVRTAAPLGDALSAILLGLGKVGSLSEDERAFWLFLGLARDHMSKDKKHQATDDFTRKLGTEHLDRGIARYGVTSILGRDVEFGLPSRNDINTMFVESDVRGTFQNLLGIIRPTGPVPEAPTLRENWQFYRYIIDDLGWGAAFLLLPGSKESTDGHIIVRSRTAIVSRISAGDRIFARCGPFSHVAMVYSIDRSKGEVLLADAAYQFWQHEQNACVTSFKLNYTDPARPLTSVSIADVTSVLEAVVTVRDVQ